METKRAVLAYVAGGYVVDAEQVARAFGYTPPGAASLLLRYHRHGCLNREARAVEGGGRAYEYQLSSRGEEWLSWAEGQL